MFVVQLTKETAAQIAFYLSLVQVVDAVVFIAGTALLALGTIDPIVHSDRAWMAYGAIVHLLLLATLAMAVVGLHSKRKTRAKQSLIITFAAMTARYLIPFMILIYLMSQSGWAD